MGARTSKNIKFIIVSTVISSSTYPTPFIVTLTARHMIASLILLCTVATIWALQYTILFDICSHFRISNITTLYTWMTHCFTFKAHSLAALARGSILIYATAYSLSSHKVIAPKLWTPC